MAKVSDFMTRKVVTISPEATIYEASRVMTDKNIGGLIVVVGMAPLGMITERDIVTRVISKKINPSRITVNEVMSKPVVTCSLDCTIDEAASIMQSYKIKRLPVLKGKDVAGIFTTYDLMVARGEEFNKVSATLAELVKER